MLRPLLFIYTLLICISLLLAACAPRAPVPTPSWQADRLESMGYSVQVGAFAMPDNASSLMRELDSKGLGAYYFRDRDGLYKVRFGNFPDRESAKLRAARLASRDILQEYFVVDPESYPAAKMQQRGSAYVRQELVDTARNFLGTSYQWGGTSEREGFDCSGLTMAVYRHNGLNMPRVAASQYRYGKPVSRRDLHKGDLIFFDTKDQGEPTHVGLYIGRGRFIHAPSSDGEVTTDSLSRSYFRSHFLGARTYL